MHFTKRTPSIFKSSISKFVALCSSFLLSAIFDLKGATCLVQFTQYHKLYYVIPHSHEQIHYLSKKRLDTPELVFWNGIGSVDEKVYILAAEEDMNQYKPSLELKNFTVEIAYNTVKIAYVEENPEHPNTAPVGTLLDKESESEEDDEEAHITMNDPDELDDNLSQADKLEDQVEAEMLILKRKNKYRSGDGDPTEHVASTPRTPGLVPAKPLIGHNGRELPISSGIMYRIQGVQTLIQGAETTVANGDWVSSGEDQHSDVGMVPRLGEYLEASFRVKRNGENPYMTAEEDRHWKNEEYQRNKTKAVLWLFVPTEEKGYYEIRSRNYPMSIMVWVFDIHEGEFVLGLESRRQYLRRYQVGGDLRYRALFTLEMVPEQFTWELQRHRPKFRIITHKGDHVYLYESTKKHCSILVVRNGAEHPYQPHKTDKIGRHLDMFYITRLNLTGKYTASIFSLMYEKTIVDIFADAEEKGYVANLGEFDMMNRTPLNSTQYVFEEITQDNNFTFKFHDSLKAFQWVTIEAHLPSFGVAPTIQTGVVGANTDTKEIKRSVVKKYHIHDKISLESGENVNATILYQYTENFENPFVALMEIQEPVDRLYWDFNGRPRFIRGSMPGTTIERSWDKKARFHYVKVIERREGALLVQVKGSLVASYGLRGFVKATHLPQSAPIIECEAQ